ncbi:glucose-1-phosphate adenylyltransferase subunit GlgD [Streptococcus halichoeri]|uniref:glucose-1-phosphate adenylyltransferase subunit GlgD n=1 Tax=Streptococcus halichoeri TaxID=254785 RepID=UPI00135BFE64|nr:glucose-1-phosphate adenylyltransferase subunit GlgD [Streptococcus halichoeri]
MKIDKYSAILGSAMSYDEMGGLTDSRPLANLPFDGKFRLIDFHLSSLANAGVRNIYGIFRGENIRSVFDHVRSGREWGLNTLLSHSFLGFYRSKGTSVEADADYYDQILTYLKRSGSDQTIYMSCDIICNIELEQVIQLHQTNQRQITVVYKKTPKELITDVNDILDIDETRDIVRGKSRAFAPTAYEKMSTGIYIVNTPWLIEQMEKEASKENPANLRYLLRDLTISEGALAFEYTGYLANIHSAKSYYDANMDMLEPDKFYALLYANQRIYTRIKNEEATYFAEESYVNNSQFASGSIIKGHVDHSIVSRNCYIDVNTKVANSIIAPKVRIGIGTTIEYAIIDKLVEVDNGVTIRGTKEKPLVIPKGTHVTEDIIK